VAQRLDIGEVTLAYEDTGTDGPVVVFVHGLGGSVYGWWGQLSACGDRGYRGVAYDQRGAGLSDKPEGPYSVAGWAEDLARLLDGLGLERVALVGHSVGCMVAQHTSVRLGERIWALAVVGGALEWRPEAGAVFEERVRLARSGRMDEIAATVAGTGLSERGRADDPVLHGLMLDTIASNDPRAYAASTQATAAGSMQAPERVPCPTLAVAGAEDPVTPPGFAAAVADAIPGGESTSIRGAAHWCMLERPEAVNDALFGFLDRARGRT
jgi:pimeloyl-ACP methyl ester carboxylesterase